MKITVSVYDFRDAFIKLRPDNFTYSGLTVLFDYFEEIESDTGEEIELDVIAICCEYAEDTAQGIAENYGIDVEGLDDEEEITERVIDHLIDEGAFIGESDAGIVYRQF
jgi:hypothetical protein